MSTIKKGLLVLLGMCAIVAVFQPDRPVDRPADPPAAATQAVPTPAPATPTVPPEPPPPVAHKASEVPQLEAELAADPAYCAVWNRDHEDDLKLFLTYVGELVAEGSAPATLAEAVTKKNLKASAIKLFLIFTRQGRFPDDFAQRVESHLAAVKAQPHMGLWTEFTGAKSVAIHDFTALALVLHRDRPDYLRERLAAKKAGPMRWSGQTEPKDRPYLVSEEAAMKWLALLTPLTPDEQARLAFLRLPAAGTPLRIGELVYVVESVRVADRVGQGFAVEKAPAGVAFVVVNYTIENQGNATSTVLADDLCLLDAQGREFRPSSRANTALMMSGGKDFLLSEVQPGLKKAMKTAFEMPADAARGDLRLVLGDEVVVGVEVR